MLKYDKGDDNMLDGILMLLVYFIICATIALFIRFFSHCKKEVFRKMLHLILVGSSLVFLYVFPTWQYAVITAIVFAIALYPILWILEHHPAYSEITTQRHKGELKQSLIIVFSMFAIVIGICWGYFHNQHLALTSIFAWGLGDAAAALIGKKYGKHKIKGAFLDGKKSYEGSFAMFLCSFTSTMILLSFQHLLSLPSLIITSLFTALTSTISELYAKNGNDTIICPISAMISLLLCITILGG